MAHITVVNSGLDKANGREDQDEGTLHHYNMYWFLKFLCMQKGRTGSPERKAFVLGLGLQQRGLTKSIFLEEFKS
jgi:hypothetical protein